jgi:hypothetical protein
MAVTIKITAFQEIGLYSLEVASVITVMMAAVCTSETSACFKETTWHYIPEGSDLYVTNTSYDRS